MIEKGKGLNRESQLLIAYLHILHAQEHWHATIKPQPHDPHWVYRALQYHWLKPTPPVHWVQ